MNKAKAWTVVAGCVLLMSGCEDAPVPEKLPDNPKHVWSEHQQTYREAKEVAGFVNEQQRLKEERVKQLGIVR